MAQVDRAMERDYGIDLTRMMENAGSCLARLAARRFLGDGPRRGRILVLAGSGGNGGGALVAARRLAGWGAEVGVWLSRPLGRLSPLTAKQALVLDRMGIELHADGTPGRDESADLVVDGLIGYGLRASPAGRAAELIEHIGTLALPVLSLDVPSGIDASAGRIGSLAVRATATLTLALPKAGLRLAPEWTGDLYLADIGVPLGLYARPPLRLRVPPLFQGSDLVRLVTAGRFEQDPCIG